MLQGLEATVVGDKFPVAAVTVPPRSQQGHRDYVARRIAALGRQAHRWGQSSRSMETGRDGLARVAVHGLPARRVGMIGCAGEDGPTTATATPSTSPLHYTHECHPRGRPSGETVEISLWHSEQASNLDTLQRLARRFNDSQSDVKVKLAFQGTSDENVVKVLASLQGGDLPTIAYLDEVQAQLLIDSGGFRPMQEFVDRMIRPLVSTQGDPVLHRGRQIVGNADLDLCPHSHLQQARLH
jgi:hypothetical protein